MGELWLYTIGKDQGRSLCHRIIEGPKRDVAKVVRERELSQEFTFAREMASQSSQRGCTPEVTAPTKRQQASNREEIEYSKGSV